MEKKIKLLALDLDGTTFNSNKEITRRTRDAIEAAIEKGVIVMPSTGRQWSGLPESIVEIPGIRYALTSNGALIVDLETKQVVHGDYLDKQTTIDLINWLLQYDCMVDTYRNGRCFVDKKGYERLLYVYKNMPEWFVGYVRKTRTPVEDLAENVFAGEAVIEKVLATFDDMEIRKKVWEQLSKRDDVYLSNGLPINIEINAVTATKGNSILSFAGKMGIERNQIMVCGDATNDRTMMEAAGLAVAMGNAVPEIKALADYVTLSNDEDGVAAAIEKFILGE